MIRKKWNRLLLSFFALLLLGSFSSYAVADEIIDDITVHADANGEVDAVIKFIVPIQYLRHFPQGKAPYSAIFFNVLGSVPADVWQDYETHRTPPSDIIQDITVSTRDRGTGPKVQIKFFRPVEFSVNLGRNAQTLVIHIKPGVPQQKNESKPAPAPAAAVPAPTAAVAALPVIAKATASAAPSATLPAAAAAAIVKPIAAAAALVSAPTVTAAPAAPAKPAAAAPVTPPPAAAPPLAAPAVAAAAVKPLAPLAPVAASSVAAAPVAAVAVAPVVVAPVAPSGDITAPKVVLTPSQLKPVHIPLGGKDGLPAFPDLDQAIPLAKSSSEKPTLSEQIMKANNQASALMLRGGNAILAGQMFLAVESFNNVLNLPPNKYTQDAQLWIGISRERSGQLDKAVLEFSAYLKLYPNGTSAGWVKDRLAQLKVSQPALFTVAAKPVAAPAKIQNTEFQTSEFGSLSMYFYTGASQTTTTTSTPGTSQAPSSLSSTDQKSLMTNLNMTARSYNNEYDNRLVLQDFYAANFLQGQQNSNRLSAAYYELKDRIVDYSVKIGRQSGMGGGVMGRFDGISAGVGITSNYKVNVVTGKLSDVSLDKKPKFSGAAFDFGIRDPLGGSVYFISQSSEGITDRRAVGGNLRYFEQAFTVMSMLDYDTQFKALNMLTVQGTWNGGGTKNDYNFLLDRRKSPMLDVRNAISGTTSTIASLLQNGYSMSDLILLAGLRTTVTNSASVGMTNHLNDKWNTGTDFSISNTSGMPQSGDLIGGAVVDTVVNNVIVGSTIVGGTPGLAGFVPATPGSGIAWTISQRLTGLGVVLPRDVTNVSVSFTKSQLTKSESIQVSNHADLQDKWSLDTTARVSLQSANSGDKSSDISPTARVSYKVRDNLNVDGQLGIDWTKTTSSTLQSSSSSVREFLSLGFRLDF